MDGEPRHGATGSPDQVSELRSEAAARADFSEIRYAQVWEDADVLLEGLDVQPGHVCVSIASAGDNALALLTRDPAQVIALDLNPAQLACLELRVAAYRALTHPELLELVGSRPSTRRAALYARCRRILTDETRQFWDAQSAAVAAGIGGAGKFERYFALFRQRVLPLVHSSRRVQQLLIPREPAGRRRLLRFAVGHLALAPDVSPVLLAHGHGAPRARSRVLPLRRG